MKKEKMFLIISNIIISIILGLMFSTLSIVIINAIFLFILLVILKKDKIDMYKHINIIYGICIIAMMLLYYGYNLKYDSPYYLGGSDDKNFELWAEQAIEEENYTIYDINHNKSFEYYNCNGFIWFMSILIRFCNFFGGYHTIVIRLINIYFLIFIGILVYKYFYKHEKKEYIPLLYIMILFPNTLYISIHGFRDTLFSFIIFSIFYLTSSIKSKKLPDKICIIIYTLLFSYLAYYIREAAIIYILIILIINLLLGNKKIELNKKTIVLISMIGVISIIIMYCLGIFSKIQGYLDRYSEYILAGNDGLASKIFTTPFLPYGFILRIMYGLIFPSPTGIIITKLDVDTICKFILSIGTILQIYLLPYILKNIKRLDGILIIYTVVFASIIFTTFGFRHFILLYPFMFLLIARQYINTDRVQKKKLFYVMTSIILIGALFYIILKFI